jgi:hypothetical protein
MKKLSKAKVKRITTRSKGRQGALGKLTSEELCQDLANTAVRRIIARRKRWKPRRATGCHYSELAAELCFLPLRSLEKLSSNLDDLMREYILAFLDNDHHHFLLPADLLGLLAKEYIRDRTTLSAFLSDVLKRKRTISAPGSLWSVRLVTEQIAQRYGHNRKRILDELQKRGLIPSTLTPANQHSWLSKIGQYLSRDQRAAVGKDFGFRSRPKPSSFGGLLKHKPKKKSGDENQLTVP